MQRSKVFSITLCVHALLEQIEHDIREALPQTTVFTHLEALEDPTAWADQQLDRTD